jgi:cell division protein FtsN
MTRDFAKKPRNTNRRSGYQSRVPGWVWLFTGSVLGAFVMFLVYLAGIPPQPSEFPELSLREVEPARVLEPHSLEQHSPEQPSPETVSTQNTPPEQAEPKPRFDFYQLLKESEVAKVEPPTTRAPVNFGTEYTLQVGSFRNAADADRLRAELILMNLEARVEKVTVRNAETWHRVLVGPYSTRAQLAKARGTLAANNLDSLVFKQNAQALKDG